MVYVANPERYDGASFRRCGRSGIVLPPVSLGLWQNFGGWMPSKLEGNDPPRL